LFDPPTEKTTGKGRRMMTLHFSDHGWTGCYKGSFEDEMAETTKNNEGVPDFMKSEDGGKED